MQIEVASGRISSQLERIQEIESASANAKTNLAEKLADIRGSYQKLTNDYDQCASAVATVTNRTYAVRQIALNADVLVRTAESAKNRSEVVRILDKTGLSAENARKGIEEVEADLEAREAQIVQFYEDSSKVMSRLDDIFERNGLIATVDAGRIVTDGEAAAKKLDDAVKVAGVSVAAKKKADEARETLGKMRAKAAAIIGCEKDIASDCEEAQRMKNDLEALDHKSLRNVAQSARRDIAETRKSVQSAREKSVAVFGNLPAFSLEAVNGKDGRVFTLSYHPKSSVKRGSPRWNICVHGWAHVGERSPGDRLHDEDVRNTPGKAEDIYATEIAEKDLRKAIKKANVSGDSSVRLSAFVTIGKDRMGVDLVFSDAGLALKSDEKLTELED